MDDMTHSERMNAFVRVLGGVDNAQELCNGVFSQWSYINDWAMGDTAGGCHMSGLRG